MRPQRSSRIGVSSGVVSWEFEVDASISGGFCVKQFSGRLETNTGGVHIACPNIHFFRDPLGLRTTASRDF